MRIGWIILAGYLLLALAMPATAQELDAKITVNHNQIQGTDASVFDNLQQTLEQFVNDGSGPIYSFRRMNASPATLTSRSPNTTRPRPVHLQSIDPSQ
jgi:hypothetical protein